MIGSHALNNNSNKVVSIGIRYIADEYNTFLEDKKAGSVNTFKNYRGDLRQFFREVYGKEYDVVTIDDLANTTGNDMVKYRNMLRDKYSATSTVNRKINAVRSLFKYIEADNEEVRSSIFNKVSKLKETNKKGWGILTYEEVIQMIEISKTYGEDGDRLSMLIELAFKTGIRLDALLSLKWSDIHVRQQHGKKIHVIEVVDKGEIHKKSIADKVMNDINKLKETDDVDEIIFKGLYDKKVGSYIRDLCKDMNIDPRRKIVFHSLKKASINFVYDVTGDIMMAQKQGNHKDPATTIKSYMEHKEDLTAMPSYTMGDEIDISELEVLTKDEILELIRNSSAKTKLELMRINK